MGRYFGKSTTRHKLSKYLGGSNATNDLKMSNKEEDYNIEASNAKIISQESDFKANEQLKVTRCINHKPFIQTYFDKFPKKMSFIIFIHKKKFKKFDKILKSLFKRYKNISNHYFDFYL